MTTQKPEQKDILEKLNEIALETNWGTVERVNGMPKAIAVIQEAMEEIKRLRESVAEYEDLIRICNERTWRKKFNEEIWEKELGHKLSTPDFDFVYELFFMQREKLEELYNFKRKLEDELIENGFAEYVDDKIKTLTDYKNAVKEILTYVGNLYDDCDQRFKLKDYQWHKKMCETYGVKLDEKNS